MKIRIAIADDHPMIIDGLNSIIAGHPHIVLTATYPDGASLLQGLKNDIPDVLLLDIQMPDKTGDELAHTIIKKYPDIKILTLTNFDSTLYVNNMLRHGVKGYLLKTTDKKTLLEAIEAVNRGEEYLEPVMREKLQLVDMRIKGSITSRFTLTLREKEVLQLIVDGLTCPQIAEKIHLSVHTVENYRDSILFKLDVKNTATLVKKALTLGLAE